MLDGNAFRAHFPDDPDADLSGYAEVPRLRNSAALLAALAALEDEFRTILKQHAASTD
jgi:hypothetical protein